MDRVEPRMSELEYFKRCACIRYGLEYRERPVETEWRLFVPDEPVAARVGGSEA